MNSSKDEAAANAHIYGNAGQMLSAREGATLHPASRLCTSWAHQMARCFRDLLCAHWWILMGSALENLSLFQHQGLYKFEGQPEINEDSSKSLHCKPHIRLMAQKGAFFLLKQIDLPGSVPPTRYITSLGTMEESTALFPKLASSHLFLITTLLRFYMPIRLRKKKKKHIPCSQMTLYIHLFIDPICLLDWEKKTQHTPCSQMTLYIVLIPNHIFQ